MDLRYDILDKIIISNCIEKLYEIEQNSGGDPYSKKTFKDILIHPTNVNFICKDGENFVGIATWNEKSSKFGGSIYMVNISVKKEYHRKGIATKLIAYAFSYYKKDAVKNCYSLEVDKTNLNAIELYKKSGFEFDNNYSDEDQYGMIKKS